MQDIFIQSKVIDIFPKFKMAAATILDFQFMWIWPFRLIIFYESLPESSYNPIKLIMFCYLLRVRGTGYREATHLIGLPYGWVTTHSPLDTS